MFKFQVNDEWLLGSNIKNCTTVTEYERLLDSDMKLSQGEVLYCLYQIGQCVTTKMCHELGGKSMRKPGYICTKYEAICSRMDIKTWHIERYDSLMKNYLDASGERDRRIFIQLTNDEINLDEAYFAIRKGERMTCTECGVTKPIEECAPYRPVCADCRPKQKNGKTVKNKAKSKTKSKAAVKAVEVGIAKAEGMDVQTNTVGSYDWDKEIFRGLLPDTFEELRSLVSYNNPSTLNAIIAYRMRDVYPEDLRGASDGTNSRWEHDMHELCCTTRNDVWHYSRLVTQLIGRDDADTARSVLYGLRDGVIDLEKAYYRAVVGRKLRCALCGEMVDGCDFEPYQTKCLACVIKNGGACPQRGKRYKGVTGRVDMVVTKGYEDKSRGLNAYKMAEGEARAVLGEVATFLRKRVPELCKDLSSEDRHRLWCRIDTIMEKQSEYVKNRIDSLNKK